MAAVTSADGGSLKVMATAALVLGIIGVVLAGGGLAQPLAIERARRPTLLIERSENPDATAAGFVCVVAINPQPRGRLGRHVQGITVTNCHGSIEFLQNGESVLGDPIPARWSDTPAPPAAPPASSYRWDLPATGVPAEIAVAVTNGNEAFAFSAESYEYGGRKPEWRLPPGDYGVRIRLAATEATAEGEFRLAVARDGALALTDAN
jgi:hypothetical protein